MDLQWRRGIAAGLLALPLLAGPAVQPALAQRHGNFSRGAQYGGHGGGYGR